jgi:hypothetical protein
MASHRIDNSEIHLNVFRDLLRVSALAGVWQLWFMMPS